MASKFLKKIIAKDQQGLNTISAICSESKIKVSDIKFLKNNQIFLLLIERFNKEGSKKEKKINSILKFEYINASKSKNINQNKYSPEPIKILLDTAVSKIVNIVKNTTETVIEKNLQKKFDNATMELEKNVEYTLGKTPILREIKKIGETDNPNPLFYFTSNLAGLITFIGF